MAASHNEEEDPSYIDYETFLAPDFNPSSFANNLVLSTNNPNDSPLDLSTPLSRVLFDIQEIDSHIDQLTTRSAIPLLTHTEEQTAASGRIVSEIDGQVRTLNESYRQLEKEVIRKHAEADTVRQVASRLWETLRLGRSVARCLQLGRQLELQHSELASSGSAKREDHHALVRCAHTILSLREILERRAPGEEGHRLDAIDAVRTLQESVIAPIERSVRELSERIVREYSMGTPSAAAGGGGPTFAQMEEARARMVSALVALYLLSPTALAKNEKWSPAAMLQALEMYLRSALQSSIASLARSLAALPSLDRTLAEVSARCQNIVALELLLESTKAPPHPLRDHILLSSSSAAVGKGNLLQPLLAHLETGSLASYFWRTMASSLSTRVQEIMNRGGVSARTLRSNKNNVGDAIRECVVRGCQLPSSAAVTGPLKGKGKAKPADAGPEKAGGWDREIAVMVGSVVGNIGR